MEQTFITQLPLDEYGNVASPPVQVVEITTDESEYFTIINPSDCDNDWPWLKNDNIGYGTQHMYIEVDGPVRELSLHEWIHLLHETLLPIGGKRLQHVVDIMKRWNVEVK